MAVFSPAINTGFLASATSVNVSVDAAFAQMRLYNAGPNKAFVKWGVGVQSAIASVTYVVVPPDAIEVFDKGAATSLAAITSGGTETAQLYISVGWGQ
jgi:hypothetical protein